MKGDGNGVHYKIVNGSAAVTRILIQNDSNGEMSLYHPTQSKIKTNDKSEEVCGHFG